MSQKKQKMGRIRLDKYLSTALGITRTEAKTLITKGRVTVEDKKEKEPATKVDGESASVFVDGKPCHYEEFHYYMLHKPAGVVSAVSDETEKTVIDLIGEKNGRLFPVGRLDKDTEGLLLITDDGVLSHRLLSPRKHVDKCYFALLNVPAVSEDVEAFKKGLDIGEKNLTMPAKLEIEKEDPRRVRVTLQEGKFHQVKRMFLAVGKKVEYLKRLSMGPLVLDPNLPKGEYRALKKEEIESLREWTNE